jgi:uncharacterized Zn finger protein
MISLLQDCEILETRKDGYGKIVVIKRTPCKCRTKEKFQLIVNQNAEKVTSQIEFTVPVDIDVKVGFQIEFEADIYTILSIKLTRNTLGEVAKKVVFV